MNWGQFVRKRRLDAGHGLRRFAELIGILPSNYNHMEKGRIPPPQSKERLDQIAELLEIEQGSDDYHNFMDLAVAGKNKLPADVESYVKQNELAPILLRTLDNRKMNRQELEELVRELNEDLTSPKQAAETDGEGVHSEV